MCNTKRLLNSLKKTVAMFPLLNKCLTMINHRLHFFPQLFLLLLLSRSSRHPDHFSLWCPSAPMLPKLYHLQCRCLFRYVLKGWSIFSLSYLCPPPTGKVYLSYTLLAHIWNSRFRGSGNSVVYDQCSWLQVVGSHKEQIKTDKMENLDLQIADLCFNQI